MLFMKISLSQILAFVSLPGFAILTACGASYNDHEVKDYRLTVVDADAAVHDTFEKLVEQYNNDAGFKAITYVRDAGQANSDIYLVAGLQSKDGKIGWGQWIKETDEGSQMPRLTNRAVDRDNIYS